MEMIDDAEVKTDVVPVTQMHRIDPNQLTQTRNDSIGRLIESAYAKAGTLQLTPEESKALQEEFPDEAFRTGAAGKESLIYIEHADLRDRFNSVLGLGQWTLVPIKEWTEDFEFTKRDGDKEKVVHGVKIYREVALMVRGCFVGSAVGDMDFYPDNLQANYGDAYEGAKTAAFRRCAKEFGVGLQAWRRNWCDGWHKRRRYGDTSPEANGMEPGARNATQKRREEQSQQPQQQRYPDKKVCPVCMAQAVGRSQYPPRNNPNGPKGWFCYPKSGGCGKVFPHDEPSFAEGEQSRNPTESRTSSTRSRQEHSTGNGNDEIQASVDEWMAWAATPTITVDTMNRVCKESAETDWKKWSSAHRVAVWNAIVDVAKGRGWEFNPKTKSFFEVPE